MNIVKKILPHLCIILSGFIVIFVVIDNFNNAMGLIDQNGVTKALIFILGVVSVVVSSMLIYKQRREN
jgi:hypothetical protein